MSGEKIQTEQVAVALDAACPRPERSQGGRPPYPTLVMVKVLLVQALYDLSDEQGTSRNLGQATLSR